MANKTTYNLVIYQRNEMKFDGERKVNYMLVETLGGDTVRISERLQNKDDLWAAFNDARPGDMVSLTYETSPKGITFLVNAEVVVIASMAVQEGLRNALNKALSAQDDERLRSQSISYAKDLVCAGYLAIDGDFYQEAGRIFAFIKGLPAGTDEY